MSHLTRLFAYYTSIILKSSTKRLRGILKLFKFPDLLELHSLKVKSLKKCKSSKSPKSFQHNGLEEWEILEIFQPV